MAQINLKTAPGHQVLAAAGKQALRPGVTVLELAASFGYNASNIDTTHRDLSTTIRVNASPLSTEDWAAACQTAGLIVERCDIGPMTLLNPRQIAQEEGMSTLMTIGWNMLTRPVLCQRILSMGKLKFQNIDRFQVT